MAMFLSFLTADAAAAVQGRVPLSTRSSAFERISANGWLTGNDGQLAECTSQLVVEFIRRTWPESRVDGKCSLEEFLPDKRGLG